LGLTGLYSSYLGLQDGLAEIFATYQMMAIEIVSRKGVQVAISETGK
jgi:hypothetical protein